MLAVDNRRPLLGTMVTGEKEIRSAMGRKSIEEMKPTEDSDKNSNGKRTRADLEFCLNPDSQKYSRQEQGYIKSPVKSRKPDSSSSDDGDDSQSEGGGGEDRQATRKRRASATSRRAGESVDSYAR